jgi:hypothetical protein
MAFLRVPGCSGQHDLKAALAHSVVVMVMMPAPTAGFFDHASGNRSREKH